MSGVPPSTRLLVKAIYVIARDQQDKYCKHAEKLILEADVINDRGGSAVRHIRNNIEPMNTAFARHVRQKMIVLKMLK